MQRSRLRRFARWFAAGLALLLVAGLVLYVWGVGAILRAVVAQQYGGHAVIGDWWINGTTAGINGVRLSETADPASPQWLETGRITTDLSIRSLLHGRFLPTEITVERPRLALRFRPDGQLATALPFRAATAAKTAAPKPTASSFTLPRIRLRDAEATIAQEGRPPLVIHQAEATMTTVSGREQIEATTDDPVWGHLTVTGSFSPTFRDGTVSLRTGPQFVGTMDMARSIPFVPAEVWENLRASGPLDATVDLRVALGTPEPVHATTHLTLRGASATVVPLQVDTTETTGTITIDGAQIVVDNLRGRAINGTFATAGRLDFAQNPPAVALNLRLRGIDVQRTPAAWQLGELGATGTLTARADLRARLGRSIDLTGTTGEAVIDNGSLQGIPLQSVVVDLRAEGGDLQYATKATDGPIDRVALESEPTLPAPDALRQPGLTPNRAAGRSEGKSTGHPLGRLTEPALAALPLIRVMAGDSGFLGFTAFAISEAIEIRTQRGTTPPGSLLRLPKTISTQVELKDVDLRTILLKAEKYGIRVKFPVSGRLSVRASATIPLANPRALKAYVIHGDAQLSQASIAHFDLGNLEAHLDVENGIVDLSDFRGVLVDHPADDLAANAPAPPAPPREGDLPDGGFRGGVHAEIAPLGRASARFEAKRLPLGELGAPFLPHPTPLSGDLSTLVQADVNLAQYRDPNAYTLVGSFESRRVAYRGALLDRMASRFAVREGRATVDELSARLAGRPLNVHGGLTLRPPYRFEAGGLVDGWEIADVLKFVPTLPQSADFAGRVDAQADARGTLLPFRIETGGNVHAVNLRLGPVPVRSVVGKWRTEQDEVVLKDLEVAVFDGRITGDARVPAHLTSKQPASLTLGLKGIDTKAIAQLLPDKAPGLEGLADGRVQVKMPLDASTVDATAVLNAPDLRFQPEGRYGPRIAVANLRVAAQARDRLLRYETTAQTLGARILFTGSLPLDKDPARAVASAEARVVGFRLGEAWRGLGLSGGIAELDGEGAVDANLRATAQPPRLWSRGLFELRGLRYGSRLPIGEIRGQASYSPTEWKLEGVEGTLFGGIASGDAYGLVQNNRLGESTFHFRVDRAAVPKLLAGVPALAKGSDGFGSLRVTGRLDEALNLSLDIHVPSAKVLNMTVTDVRLPAEVNLSPASGVGALHARHWTGRLAGGAIEGNAVARLGTDRSFRSDIKLTNVDLAVLSRIGAVPSQASAGKLTGTVRLEGPNPENLGKVRGNFNFDLDDATLVAIPGLRELQRFLGGVGEGALFSDGDVSGRISNETLNIEQLTLDGQLAQLHALGSVTFKGGLNLEVLVNTNSIIPKTGLPLFDNLPRQLSAFLSGRLLKFRITGTAQNPVVALDPSITVGDTAAGFFAGALRGSR